MAFFSIMPSETLLITWVVGVPCRLHYLPCLEVPGLILPSSVVDFHVPAHMQLWCPLPGNEKLGYHRVHLHTCNYINSLIS